MAKKPSWGLIILGIAVFTVIVGVGVIAIAGFVIYQQFAPQATTTSASRAEGEFKKIAAQFGDQKPLLEFRDDQPVLNTHRVKATGRVEPIEALHVMIWQPDEGKLVKLNLPFWILRMTKGHPIRIGGSTEDMDGGRIHLNLTAEEIERYGPGLVIDRKDADGKRVLVWAQEP